MAFLLGLSAVALALFFGNKRKQAKVETVTNGNKFHITAWAIPSEYYGHTYNPGNTTTFTGNESLVVPTVPYAFECNEIEPELALESVNPQVEINTVTEEQEVTNASMEHLLSVMGVTMKGSNIRSESDSDKKHAEPTLDKENQSNPLMSYKEAELDNAVSAFANNFLGIQSVTDNESERLEREDNTSNYQSTNSDHATIVTSSEVGNFVTNNDDNLLDYRNYLKSLNQPIQTDSEIIGGNIMTNNPSTVQPKEDKYFLETVNTNLLEAILKERPAPEKPRLEPIVLTAEDWFKGEHEQYVQINAQYDEFCSHKIIEAALGMQTWVVQILGQQNEYIHVSDGTARIWLDVSDFIGKPMDIGSIVMMEVVSAESTLQVETYSLLESPCEEDRVKMNRKELSEYDYGLQMFNEYGFEEKEQFIKLA